ncbi:TonB-dependent receptor [Altererythrobacter sp.]|uniref:TonB-dependent receptor n=1 Tax=Altererythrobacter sp. TaxID=1872480 RepID=UPI003D0CDD34
MKIQLVMGSAMALILATHTGTALAQSQDASATADTGAESGVGDIIVTAQRRKEKLQDVAVSATAFDANALADKAVVNLADLQNASPALSISDGGITQSINIRGIGLASNSPSVTAGVATYVDGLFQPPIVQANSFYDLASVEVLRGPQGTLVGSNSTGGAIFINTQNPQLFDGVGGYAMFGVGNYDSIQSEAALNLPVSDTFGFRAAGFYRRHDSYFKSVGPVDTKAGKLDEGGGRLTAMWDPGSFQAVAKVSFNDRDTGGYAYRPILGTPYEAYRVGDIRTLSFDTPVANREKAFQASLELKQELTSGIVLRTVTGYQHKRINALNDVDASAGPDGIAEDYFAGEKEYTQEINIISPTDGPFDWILGGYFQRNDIAIRILDDQGGFPTDIIGGNQRTTTGLFAQGNYELVPGLEAQLGARYSTYKATGYGDVTIGRDIPGFPPDGLAVASLAGRHKDSLATGKFALNWKVDPDNLLYALVARGYKPGGFNSPTSNFEKERVISYEAGWKSAFLNNRIRTQVSAFYNKYANFQFNVVEPSTGFAGVENISTVEIKGVEAQVQGRFGGFGFDANVAFVDSDLASVTFVNTRTFGGATLGPQCPAGVPSSPPICFDYTPFIQTTGGGPNLYAPRWTFGGGVEYEFLLGGEATLTPRLNYAYVGEQFTYIGYSPLSDRLNPRGLLSAIVTLQLNDNLKVEAWGTNLTNKDYITGQLNSNEFYGAPREYGIKLGVTF